MLAGIVYEAKLIVPESPVAVPPLPFAKSCTPQKCVASVGIVVTLLRVVNVSQISVPTEKAAGLVV